MALHLVQDSTLRRVLDFLGLRGIVQHEYESTILSTIEVAKLPSPIQVRIVTGTLIPGVDLVQVPQDETWEPILFFAEITQSAGAVVPRYTLNALQSGFFFDLESTYATQTLSGSHVLSFTAGLNETTSVYCDFSHGVLLAPGTSIQYLNQGGNGTIVMNNQAFLMYRRLGERLVSQT
jgi:hypothetical protein